MVIIFITCKNKKEAEKIGLALLQKRLAACTVIIPKVYSAYFWPPRSQRRQGWSQSSGAAKNRIEKSGEVILLVKTLKQKFSALEKEVRRLHSYTIPFIAAVPVVSITKEYLKWLESELLN